MMKHKLYAGSSRLETANSPVSGEQVEFESDSYYRIRGYDQLRPFLMSLVSNADHWMFISSTGALTAGRRNPDHALFPYYTEDKVHDSAGVTGSRSFILVRRNGREYLWSPFFDRYSGIYELQRSLFKSVWGNKIIFEEVNKTLGLTFRYGWFNSEQFGFIRRSWLVCSGKPGCEARVVDGIQNILPSGIGSQFQLEKSNLLDAYKRNEFEPETGLALFTLSSVPVDRPEPAESLQATTVWALGLNRPGVWLSASGIERFFEKPCAPTLREVRGERGAFMVDFNARIAPGGSLEWLMGADIDQSHSRVNRIRYLLKQPRKLKMLVADDITRGTDELRAIVGSADGLQKTNLQMGDTRHYGNVLFNVMRGGIFPEGYLVNSADVKAFVADANRRVAARHRKWLQQLPPTLTYGRLAEMSAAANDSQLERICREYLPLTFSRRHGDPSRPWNRFSISTRNARGERILNYEGNWRDIFQNWEALAVSFPGFTSGMVSKFVNASTPDGYNPYRITRDGLDWEVVDPHDPWSFIGYWGDHQIIYLLKLLEILRRHEPQTLRRFLTTRLFSYANVPYRIKSYASLLADPRDTVVFNDKADEMAAKRVREIGADGKLLLTHSGEVQLGNLTEKLLVSILAKLSNFVPEAGIWLNTQRPEWNDANNALVGNGASMVTLCYMRRQFAFLAEVFEALPEEEIAISADVAAWHQSVHAVLKQQAVRLGLNRSARFKGEKKISHEDRKRVLDELGKAGSAYRDRVYKSGITTQQSRVRKSELLGFFSTGLVWLDQSIRANRRRDGLYEAYNLIQISERQIRIRRLYPMLEGQAAVLSSGLLSPAESLDVLRSLRRSPLYREDQHSYLLYPDRELCPFLKKNQIPRASFRRSNLMQRLVRDQNTDIIERGTAGKVHFSSSIRNAADLNRRLDQLAAGPYARLVARERSSVVKTFEKLFDHESFTGRSGTFFAYEGLGSIYWHMVSKLLLAAQETFFRAAQSGAKSAVLRKLGDIYYDIRAGLGDAKTPEVYGAFPVDPYSHTPRHKGACQPGLTGQVKEDILCRWGELGIFVDQGIVRLNPRLLRVREFQSKPAEFAYYDTCGCRRTIPVPANSLAFTYCQTAFIYTLGDCRTLKVCWADGSTSTGNQMALDQSASEAILNRTGEVLRVEAGLTLSDLSPIPA